MKKLGTFLTGLAVGGAVALLLAPEKGEETRKKLKSKAQELTGDLDIEGYTEVGKDKWNEYKEIGSKKANEWKTAAEEALENATKKVNSNSDTTV